MGRENGRTPRVWDTTNVYPACCGRFAKVWLTILLVCLLITFLLFVIFLAMWITQKKPLKIESDAPCLSLECLQTSSSILSSLDRSISPCDNFYEYACNGWVKKNQIPARHMYWSWREILKRRTAYFMKDLLENHSIPNPSAGLVMAQAYYNACMNVSLVEQRGLTPLYTQLTQLFGGWLLLPTGNPAARSDDGQSLKKENFDLTKMYMEFIKIYGSTPLFQITIGQDIKNSSHFVIELYPGYLCRLREDYLYESSPTYGKSAAAYKALMRNYSLLLGVPPDQLHELTAVHEFEKTLAENMENWYEWDLEKTYLLTTLKNLSTMCPVFDWKLMLEQIFEPLAYTISDDQTIGLAEAAFFVARCQVFKKYLETDQGIRILHNVAVWQFIWLTSEHMHSEVERLQEDYRKIETGFKKDQERWLICVAETQTTFGWILGHIFVKEKFDQKSADAAAEMIHEIREAFKENFASVTWMQEEDKVKAIEKVDAMKASVGYPTYLNKTAEELLLLSFMTTITDSTYFENELAARRALTLISLNDLVTKGMDRWELLPQTVYTMYKAYRNHLYFPVGILQPPLYDSAHPLYLNFGGIGSMAGHQITHAFDNNGVKVDAKGNKQQWLSNETREAFEHNSQCMIDQYSNYSILNMSLNGKQTMNENIADNGGIKAAYKAFKKLESKYSDAPKLPGLEFTSDQLFFLSYAQFWCIKELPEATLTKVMYDTHTVNRYRVIGPLMNSEDFARVFSCPVGSYMNPKKKCVVW